MDFILENEDLMKSKSDVNEGKSDASGKDSVDNGLNSIEIKTDEKTEKAFTQLEDTVNKTYQKTSEVIGKYVQEDEEGIHITIPDFSPEVTEKAQQYLKSLDTNLQSAEEVASNYWNKVSGNNFWSSMSTSLTSQFDKVVKIKDDVMKSTLNSNENAPKNSATLLQVAGNRTEAELRELSNNEKLYIDNKLTLSGNFDVDQHTTEIAKLLESDKDLTTLMNNIVPTKVPYKDFWNIYFVNKEKIKEREDRRKKLLETEKQKNDDDIADWDDDGDDDEENELEEQLVIIKKEDAVEPTEVDVIKEEPKNSKKGKNTKSKNDKRKKEQKNGNDLKDKTQANVDVKPVEETKSTPSKDTVKQEQEKAEEEDDDDDDWE